MQTSAYETAYIMWLKIYMVQDLQNTVEIYKTVNNQRKVGLNIM